MLIFNDGPPRAGKSYDTMKNHVLPALRAGRPVYARLDGMEHAAVAAYLGLPELRVRELLHHVEADDVVSMFRCRREGDKYLIPEQLRDSLVVIDEVHEFYPAGMKPLEKEQEQFFARHGQFGMDIITASQTFDRLHSEIRARVERRVLFRKLSHFAALKWLGIGGKDKYSMRFSVNNGSGKFKEIGSETRKYEPAIFPLYAGYQPGTTNTAVYEGGVKEAGGAGLKFYVPLALVAAVVGLWFVIRFFDADKSALVAKAKERTGAVVYQPDNGPVGASHGTPAIALPKVEKEFKAPGVAYVMGMLKDHRPRAIGKYSLNSRRGGWVELVSAQGHAAERLSVEQLEALGFVVVDEIFGYTLTAEGSTVIATEWPQDRWGKVSNATQESVRGGAGTRASAATSADTWAPPSAESPPSNAGDTPAEPAIPRGGAVISAGDV